MPELDLHPASQSSCVLDPTSMLTPRHIPLYSPCCSLQSIALRFAQEVLKKLRIVSALPKWLSCWPNSAVSSWSGQMSATIKYATSPPSNIILNPKPFKIKQRTKSSYLVYSTTQQETPSSNCMGQMYGRKCCRSSMERISKDWARKHSLRRIRKRPDGHTLWLGWGNIRWLRKYGPWCPHPDIQPVFGSGRRL